MKNKRRSTMLEFAAQVVTGHGVGRTLGFPTLNFAVPENFELEPGVYACRVKIINYQLSIINYPGVLFFGTRETFADTQPTLEIHVFGLPTDLKIKRAEVQVLTKIREQRKFENPAELAAAIAADCATARRLLKSAGA